MNKERIVSRKATDKSQFKRKPLHFISRKLSKKKKHALLSTRTKKDHRETMDLHHEDRRSPCKVYRKYSGTASKS